MSQSTTTPVPWIDGARRIQVAAAPMAVANVHCSVGMWLRQRDSTSDRRGAACVAGGLASKSSGGFSPSHPVRTRTPAHHASCVVTTHLQSCAATGRGCMSSRPSLDMAAEFPSMPSHSVNTGRGDLTVLTGPPLLRIRRSRALAGFSSWSRLPAAPVLRGHTSRHGEPRSWGRRRPTLGQVPPHLGMAGGVVDSTEPMHRSRVCSRGCALSLLLPQMAAQRLTPDAGSAQPAAVTC
jgi:hypothetical protein